jgi:hypothetical protein
MLAASLHVGETSRVLAFKHKAPAPPEGHEPGLATLYSTNRGQAPCRKQFRHVPQTQERILDAPDLVDDYYLNLLDWSASNQVRCWMCQRLRHLPFAVAAQEMLSGELQENACSSCGQ